MARIDVQKFVLQAGEAKAINLDVSLGDLVSSNAFGTLAAYDDPWEWFCGNDLRVFVWPGPRFGGLTLDARLVGSLRESLDLAGDLQQQLTNLKR